MSDFSNKDFLETYEKVLEIVSSLSSTWNPRTSSEADPGVLTLKIATLLAVKLNYKIDLAQAQAYLDTVSNRQDAFDNLHMLGYSLRENKSAVGKISISNRKELEEDFIIPMFSQVTDGGNQVAFFTTEELVFTAGTSTSFSKMVSIMEGSVIDIQKEGKDTYSLKDLDENGRFFLEKSNIAQNGVFIGTLDDLDSEKILYDWINVETSVIHPLGKWYMILTSDSGENYIQFPDNFAELIGNSNFIVKATYSKGAAGNIYKGTLTKLVENSSLFVVRQLDDIFTGTDGESIVNGIQNYYATMDVFNTLVTNHDYSAAIRYLLQNGSRLFSNCFIRTAKDRQTKIITRLGSKEYIRHLFDTTKADRYIEALCLLKTNDYSGSFAIQDIDNEIEEYIISQLNSAESLNAEVKLINTGRYLAVTNLIGTVLANITTQAQSNEILEKIISALKSRYQASNVEFGSGFNYQELNQIIQASDSRIINVALNMPEYQIYDKLEIVDGTTKTLTEAEKIEVAAKAAVEGKLPIYKFLNRPNKSSISALDGNYISLGFGTQDYRNLADSPINPTIDFSGTSNGLPVQFEDIEKVVSLVPNQVIQFNRPLKVAHTEYGYGVTYAFYTSAKNLIKEPIQITVVTKLIGRTEIAKNSTLVFPEDSTPSSDLISKGTYNSTTRILVLNKNEAYTVLEEVKITAGSTLAVDSYIPNGSTINGSTYNNFVITDGKEYQLKDGDILRLSTSSETVEYTSGTWILPTGLSIASNGTDSSILPSRQILGTTSTIGILENDSSLISKEYMYFLKLNGKESLDFSNGSYLLQDGEYFVYADKALTEYVILEAGTLLEIEEDVVFDNVLDVENIGEATISAFVEMPTEVLATATETNAFTFGSKVDFGQLTAGERTILASMNWFDIPSDKKIIVYPDKNDSSTLIEFSSPNKARVVLILETDLEGTVKIEYPTSLKLTYEGASISMSPEDAGSKKYLTSSGMFISVISSESTKLLPEGANQRIATYSGKDITDTNLEYTLTKTSLVITAPKPLNISNNVLSVSFANMPNTKCMLANLSIKNMTASGNVVITARAGNGSGLDVINMTTNGAASFDSNIDVVLKTSIFDYQTNNNTTWIITVDPPHGETNIEIALKNLSYVEDFSDEIRYVIRDNGENLAETSLDYFNPSYTGIDTTNSVGTALLSKISSIGMQGNFNWLCTPSETLEHPTRSDNYLDKNHPANYRTIPYLDEIATKRSLKVLSVTGGRL